MVLGIDSLAEYCIEGRIPDKPEPTGRFQHPDTKSELVPYAQTELVVANGFCTVFIAITGILVDALRPAIARVDAGEPPHRTHTHDLPGIVAG
jgi:hypothetical protein